MAGTATRDLLVVDAYVAELRRDAGWAQMAAAPPRSRTSPRRFAAAPQARHRRVTPRRVPAESASA